MPTPWCRHGFIDRLARIAHSEPDIGTVTPLSNNGELTSFPRAFDANAAPSPATSRHRRRRPRQRRKSDRLPNGIGFCLYVTRACLDAVGALPTRFGRGYLEDVDFCLRAAERGFRNVCAASVYVGHLGARSFSASKRAMVVRNLDTIEPRFPAYRRECAAFMLADPLRGARAAIERALASPLSPASGDVSPKAVPARRHRLIVTGPGVVRRTAALRARALAAGGTPSLLMIVADGPAVALRHLAGAIPQSLDFHVARDAERKALRGWLRQCGIDRIEIVDPARVPHVLLDLLSALGPPLDLFVADVGLANANGRRIAKRAERVIAPSADAHVFAARFVPRKSIVLEWPAPESSPSANPLPRKGEEEETLSAGTTASTSPASGPLLPAVGGGSADEARGTPVGGPSAASSHVAPHRCRVHLHPGHRPHRGRAVLRLPSC